MSVENTVRDPETRVCSTTPRFSYAGPKTAVTPLCSAYGGWSGGVVYGRGMGIGVGRGGVIPGTPTHCSRRVLLQRSGPRKALQGLEWVVTGPGRALQPGTTLRARSVPFWALPVPGLRFPVKWPCKPQNGDISVIFQ